jgi:hypothetical protein
VIEHAGRIPNFRESQKARPAILPVRRIAATAGRATSLPRASR